MTDVGHIIGGPADPQYDGATLTQDVAIGDTVLHVDDTADFDEQAAQRDARVMLGVELDGAGNPAPSTGRSIAYATCDDETGTVTLSGVSPVAASAGDRVYVQNPVTGLPTGQVEVMVAIDDSDTTGDPITAVLDMSLVGIAGDIDLTDQAVELDEDEDGQLRVTSIPGLTQSSGDVKFMQDEFTVEALGDQVFVLTYQPLDNSEHVYWHPEGKAGIYQKANQWARDQWDLTVPDPDIIVQVGDKFVVEYAYTDPTVKPADPEPSGHWVEEAFHFRGVSAGAMFGTAAVVGAASIQAAIADSDTSSYVSLPIGSTCNVTTVPRDLTAYDWTKLRLDFDLIVDDDGPTEFEWELYIHGAGEFDGNSAWWNAPALGVVTGILSQKIPLGPEYPEPNMGDNGNVDGVFSIANTVAQALVDDVDGNHTYLNMYGPDGSPATLGIRVNEIRLVVSRWVLDA